jgi:hypothetical protein
MFIYNKMAQFKTFLCLEFYYVFLFFILDKLSKKKNKPPIIQCCQIQSTAMDKSLVIFRSVQPVVLTGNTVQRNLAK